jgi:hypothetical protein
MKKFLSVLALVATVAMQPLSVVHAVETPNFPTCMNPSGTVIANYAEGTHGIAGSSGVYVGSDVVYNVNENQVTQCFCSTDGNGIQTDWWKASSLTEEQIETLKAQGWTYIPDGTAWGLSQGAYAAKNTQYSCLPGGGGSNGGGDGKSDGRSDGRSSCPECTQAPGQVLGAQKGDVLGLAATGDSWILYTVFAAAAILLLTGAVTLRKRS